MAISINIIVEYTVVYNPERFESNTKIKRKRLKIDDITIYLLLIIIKNNSENPNVID
jgi:hypothetical protein